MKSYFIMFLCILKILETTQSPTNTIEDSDKFGDVTLNGVDYFFSNDSLKMSWEDANTYCKNKNMNLLSIETNEENLAIIGHLLSIQPRGYISGIWTSGKRTSNGIWIWNSTGKQLEYTAWFEPHYPSDNLDRDRIAISCVAYRRVEWVTAQQKDSRRFICEKI